MSTIDLYDDGGFVETVELPPTVVGTGGSFKLGRVIRQGGNGVVVEANRRSGGGNNLGRCAVKFSKRLDAARVDRFRNEARVLGELKHHRISRYFADGETEANGHKVPWIAQELGGENLRRHVESKGALSEARLGRVAIEVIQAIAHVHEKGYVHRDIKPENFVWDSNVDDSIQMIDFGIAKRFGEDVSARPLDQFTQQMEFVGPVFFSSPELIAYATNKLHEVDHRSDLFQFGKTLWYFATARISAGYPSVKSCPVGGALHRLVVALLNDDPEDRPASANIVEQELKAIFAHAG